MIKSTDVKETEDLREVIFLDKVLRLFFQGGNSWSQTVDIFEEECSRQKSDRRKWDQIEMD